MSIYDIPDHPVIRNLERTGWPDGKEPEYPHCPVCNEPEISKAYRQDGDIIGCDCCLSTKWFDDEGMPETCPVCGRQYETAYMKGSEMVGCDQCVEERDPWETEDCFYEKE